MTKAGNLDYNLSMHEVEQLGRVLSPQIRQDFRADLDQQTTAIKGFVDQHERRDDAQFEDIKASLRTGNARMSKTEKKMAWVGGAIAAVAFFTPLVIELVKWKLK